MPTRPFVRSGARIALMVVLAGSSLFFPAARGQSPNPPTPTRRFGLGELRQIAVSPDRRFMATGGTGGAYLWDLAAGTLLTNLPTPGAATALEFSPDGRALVAASGTQIQAWDTDTRALLRTYQGHRLEIVRLRFSPDGTTLCSASADNTVRFWSIATGAELRSLRIPGSPVNDAALSPDGRMLATTDTFLENTVKLWDAGTATFLRALPTTNAPVQRCLFSPLGELLVLGQDRALSAWDPATARLVRSFPGVTAPTAFLYDAWFPDAATLAAAGNDGRVFLWSYPDARLQQVIEGAPFTAATGIPAAPLLLVADLDYDIHLRQLPDGSVQRTFPGHTTSTHAAVAFSPDDRFVLSAGVERSIRLWDRASGQFVRRFIGSPAGTPGAFFSPDGRLVFGTLGLPEPGIRAWDAASGQVVRDYRWSASWPISLALSPNGSRVAAGAQDDRVRVYDVAGGQLIRTHLAPGNPTRLAFAPHQPWLACGTGDSRVLLFDETTGTTLRQLALDAGPVTGLAFGPDGDRLVVATQDGRLTELDPATFEVRRDQGIGAFFLDAASLSPDGAFLLVGESFPGFRVTLRDARSGTILRTFDEHHWIPSALGFSPDGTRVLTGSDVVREWSIADLAARLGIVSGRRTTSVRPWCSLLGWVPEGWRPEMPRSSGRGELLPDPL